jgi:short-subunit dehydrogenase
MTPNHPSGRPAIVVGASRGLGRGIATALDQAGHPVIAVARDRAALTELVEASGSMKPEVADATGPGGRGRPA